jgi:hypothetical protein
LSNHKSKCIFKFYWQWIDRHYDYTCNILSIVEASYKDNKALDYTYNSFLNFIDRHYDYTCIILSSVAEGYKVNKVFDYTYNSF